MKAGLLNVLKVAAAAACVCVGTGASAAVDLIANGDGTFENGVNGGSNSWGPGSLGTSGTIALQGTAGSYYASLTTATLGTVVEVTHPLDGLSSGVAQYDVSFLAAGTGEVRVEGSVAGGTGNWQVLTNLGPGADVNSDPTIFGFTTTRTDVLSPYSFSFLGGITSGQIVFKTTSTIAFDSVSVVPHIASAVPEPETYAMMLAGLGALGFVGRRRKNG